AVEFYHGRAATAHESYLRGEADVMRSDGYRNYWNSEALLNLQKARSQAIDNHVKGIVATFEGRKLNASYRAAEQTPRASAEQLARLNKANLPERATPSQIDPRSGRIDWPDVLGEESYAPSRKQLEEAFAARSADATQLDRRSFQKAQTSAETMKRQ